MAVGGELVLKPVSTLFSLKLHVYLGWPGESRGDCGSSKAAKAPHLGVCLDPGLPSLLPLHPHVPCLPLRLKNYPLPTKEWEID